MLLLLRRCQIFEWALGEFCRNGVDLLPHGLPVIHGKRDVIQHLCEILLQGEALLGIKLAIDFDELPGFECTCARGEYRMDQ